MFMSQNDRSMNRIVNSRLDEAVCFSKEVDSDMFTEILVLQSTQMESRTEYEYEGAWHAHEDRGIDAKKKCMPRNKIGKRRAD